MVVVGGFAEGRTGEVQECTHALGVTRSLAGPDLGDQVVGGGSPIHVVAWLLRCLPRDAGTAGKNGSGRRQG